jgi:hypothetical protein
MITKKNLNVKGLILCKGLVLFVFLLVIVERSEAQVDTAKYQIRYYDKVFLSTQGLPVFTDDLTITSFRPDEEGYYFVQLTDPVTDEMKRMVTDTGAEIVKYVPFNTFICRMTATERARVEQLGVVQFVSIFQPGFKISNNLQRVIAGELQVTPTEPPGVMKTIRMEEPDIDTLILSVSVFEGEDIREITHELERAGVTVIDSSPRKVIVSAHPAQVNRLAGIKGISRIDLQPRYQLHNNAARSVMNVTPVQTGLSLTGTGQVIGISDTGLDSGVDDASMHDDIEGNILQIFSWPVQPGAINAGADDGAADIESGHGTHTCGSIIADGTMSGGTYTGVAPDASIVFQAIEQWTDNWGTSKDGYSLSGIPADLNDLFQEAYDAGARIHSNSWGAPVAGAYNQNAEEVDEFVWNHPDMLILFSAGNSGTDDDDNGVIDEGSLGSPGTAKNCLTVGASENNRPTIVATYSNGYENPVLYLDRVADNQGGLAAFSSRGPASVNRIKPDVVAPGTMVVSTRSQSPFNVEYTDDMEAGVNGWAGTGTWNQITVDSHSPTTCWHDSPAGNYPDNADMRITSPVINLSGASLHSRTVHFWCRYDLGEGDVWKMEVSSATGQGSLTFSGDQAEWELMSIGLGGWGHVNDLTISFRLISDNDGDTGDGLYIDDVFITEGPYLTALLADYVVEAAGSVADNQYMLSNGTSMSTPLTAGVAALVREYYTETLGKKYVSAALLRATIINGAVDMTPGQYGAGVTQEISGQPDNTQGWGLVDAREILMPDLPSQLDHVDEIGGLNAGEAREYILTITDNTVPLSVTMVYHDYWGPGLQNNLDMTIEAPDGTLFYPNGLGATDNFNNIERIVIDNPALGDYTIKIDGQMVNYGPQPYAIAVRAGGQIDKRSPVDVMLVLDLSGSMLNTACASCEPKLNVLKDAVEIFTQLWSAVAVNGDRMGVTYFKTNINNFSPGGDDLPPFNAQDIIDDVTAQNTISTNLTAMGGGLQKAVNTLTDASRARSIILFTDGMQNVNPMVINDTPLKIDNASWISRSSNIPPNSPPTQLNTGLNIRVNTIGVGSTPAFTTLLNDIASATDGVFKQTNAPDEVLIQFYVEELVDVLRDYSPQLICYHYGQIGASNTSEEAFIVNNSVTKVIIKVSWARKTSLKIQINKDNADVTGRADIINDSFYTIFVFDLNSLSGTPGGTWEVKMYGREGESYQLATIVEEPRVDYSFSLGKEVYKAGEPMTIMAELSVNGRPVVSNATVKATVLKPKEGLGNLLSKYSMPADSSVRYEKGATIGQQKLALLCQQDYFYNQLQEIPVPIVLANAGGGRYTATFTDTWTPGAYTVKFYIEGKDTQTGLYRREEQMTVDFEFNEADYKLSGLCRKALVSAEGGKETLISFRPRDAMKNYLGPDYRHRISISVGGVDKSRSLKDAGDGSYELKTSESADTPLSVTVLGKTLFDGVIKELPVGGGWYASLHAGYPFTKDLTGKHLGLLLMEGDIEYRFLPHLSAQLNGGYYLFNNENSILGACVQLKAYAVRNNWLVYGEAGPGYYKPSGLNGAAAVNIGAGIMKDINPGISVSLGGNFFHIFTSPDKIDFYGIKAGVHFKL